MNKDKNSNNFVCMDVCAESNQNARFIDKDMLAVEIFSFLCEEKNLLDEELRLANAEGKILKTYPQNEEGDEEINQIATDVPKLKHKDVDYWILSRPESHHAEEIADLRDKFSKLASIFLHNENLREFIFQGLDALPNSIHICDKDLRMVYANADFARYMHVKDRDQANGRLIDDIMNEVGVKFVAVKGHKESLKAKEVLKYGKPVVDWEVEVTSISNPQDYMRASNDMYPLFDKSGKVSGVAEISRSRTNQIKQVQSVLGLAADYTFDDVIGNSQAMVEVKKLAMSFASSPYNILIYGESGTGKELFAQSIHNFGPRRKKPFVAINCANVSPELIDSELFGYESGAFTGASKSGQIGKFELADGGTLFLDEVAELPLNFQTKLLRALETKQITRIGGNKNIPVDVRVIAATNRSLENMIEEGLFREDLYYRLMVLNLTIPPLRDHKEDVLLYSDFFLMQASRVNNLKVKMLDDGAKELMQQYEWPGNIRELRNVMNRVCVMSDSPIITRATLMSALKSRKIASEALEKSKTPEERLEEKKVAIIKSNVELIKEALAITNGSRTEAAKLMGISRKTLYNMFEKYAEYFE